MDIKDKITAALIIGIMILCLFGCVPECDETIEIYNADYEVIGWECVTYNN